MKTVDVLRDPAGRNFLREFPVRQCKTPAICPVRNLEFYMDLSRASEISLSNRYLFRPTSKNGRGVIDAFSRFSFLLFKRDSLFLNALGIHDGESTHSFRDGTAILLRLHNASKENVAHHNRWKSTEMVDLYTQIDKVMGSTRLSASASNPLDVNGETLIERLGSQLQGSNLLIGFKPAFVGQLL